MQLDLFSHGRDVMLQNDVAAALRKRNLEGARKALESFTAEFPHHETISLATTLLATLASPAKPSLNRAEVAARICEIDAALVPAAERIFGRDEAPKWLSPVWSSLANAATRWSFDPGYPSAHAGSLYLRSSDWAAAEQHIKTIPSWRRIPGPLAWMIEACFHRHGLESVWHLLIELAWLESDVFRALASRLSSEPLMRLWHRFETGLGSEADLDARWFPAWLLITAPKMASVMRGAQACSGKAPERAARLMMELLLLEKQGRHAELVAHRRRLRDLCPELYEYYMATR